MRSLAVSLPRLRCCSMRLRACSMPDFLNGESPDRRFAHHGKLTVRPQQIDPYLALAIMAVTASWSAIFIKLCDAPPAAIAFWRLALAALYAGLIMLTRDPIGLAAELGALFASLDGGPGQYHPTKATRLPRPADWIGGPGGIRANARPWEQEQQRYAFVDLQFEAALLSTGRP